MYVNIHILFSLFLFPVLKKTICGHATSIVLALKGGPAKYVPARNITLLLTNFLARKLLLEGSGETVWTLPGREGLVKRIIVGNICRKNFAGRALMLFPL